MTVFFDIDTQLDFVFPAGSLYVPGAETILPRIAQLNSLAQSKGFPVISTADAHTENDPEFRTWPSHCVLGTAGQTKPTATLLGNRIIVPNRAASTTLPAPQIILEKTTFDAFSNPNLPLILDALGAKQYVVYGVVTEICVGCALRGLIRRGGAKISLVTDAVRSLDGPAAETTMRELTEAGGTLLTTAELSAALA